MKKYLTYCVTCLLALNLQAQTNLIPNGSFEEHSDCPYTAAQIDLCSFWFSPTHSTPDYFNQCAINSPLGVPENDFGIQESHSGVAYAGIVTYLQNDLYNSYREYIEVPLKSELQLNNSYHFSMYVSLADKSQMSSSDIGIYFSDSLISGISCFCPLAYNPQLFNNMTILPDSSNWTLIQGDFIASGGEKYVIIGNFKDNLATLVTLVNPLGTGPIVYLYIDDVSLYKSNTTIYPANAGEDVDLCKGKTVSLKMQALPEYQYRWFELDSTSTDTNRISTSNVADVSPNKTTHYALWVRDFKYDESWDTVTVFVTEDCENELEIPNVFTPNGDGFNDEFVIKGKNIQEISVQIFNRYGKKVAELTEATQSWDGTQSKGQKSDEGVYFWTAVINFRDGEKLNKQGTISLLR